MDLRVPETTAGGIDGWQPAELVLASWDVCIWVARLFQLIESGSPRPKACLHAKAAYLEKEGSKIGMVMSFRPLTITAPV